MTVNRSVVADPEVIRARAMESLFERLESLCEGAIAIDTGYQSNFRYGAQQSFTRSWLMPMHQTDSLPSKDAIGWKFKFGYGIDHGPTQPGLLPLVDPPWPEVHRSQDGQAEQGRDDQGERGGEGDRRQSTVDGGPIPARRCDRARRPSATCTPGSRRRSNRRNGSR